MKYPCFSEKLCGPAKMLSNYTCNIFNILVFTFPIFFTNFCDLLVIIEKKAEVLIGNIGFRISAEFPMRFDIHLAAAKRVLVDLFLDFVWRIS